MARRAVQVIQLSSTSTPCSESSDSFYSSSSEDNTQGNPIIIDVGDEIEALERARNWPFNKKRGFIVSMKRLFVEDDCRLLLQFKLASKFLRGFKDRDITLYVGNRPWAGMVKHSNEQYMLGRGWRAFVEATRLHLLADGGVYDAIIFKA